MKLVGITGKRGHGKDTAAQALEHLGYQNISFADPLRTVARVVYGLSHDEMTNPLHKEQPIGRWPYRAPREILQRIGTEMFRSYLPDTWTEAFRRACEPHDLVVCSDLRFLNEEKVIRAMGGVIVRVVNPRKPVDTSAAGAHISEQEMDQIVADHEVLNDGTIERLHWKMRDCLDLGPVTLYGSNILASSYEIGGQTVQLGDIVRHAVQREHSTPEQWNALDEGSREISIFEALLDLRAQARAA